MWNLDERSLLKRIEPILTSSDPVKEFGVIVRRYRIVDEREGCIGEMVQLHYKEVYVRRWSIGVRESRGLVLLFARDGGIEIVARPFPKFFNVNEHTESLVSRLAEYRLVECTRKRDGTLIIAGYSARLGRWLLFTRGLAQFASVDAGLEVEIDARKLDAVVNPMIGRALEILDIRTGLREFERVADPARYTLMFEAVDNVAPVGSWRGRPQYLSPELAVRGVTEKPGTREVVFLTMRDKRTGYVLRYSDAHAMVSGIFPCVEHVQFSTVDEVVERARRGDFGEGVVARYESHDGTYLLVKIKNLITFTQMLGMRGVVGLWLSGRLDDVDPNAVASPRVRNVVLFLKSRGAELLQAIEEYLEIVRAVGSNARTDGELRRALRAVGLPVVPGPKLLLAWLRGNLAKQDLVTKMVELYSDKLDALLQILRSSRPTQL